VPQLPILKMRTAPLGPFCCGWPKGARDCTRVFNCRTVVTATGQKRKYDERPTNTKLGAQMQFSPAGLLIAFFSLMIGVLLWQRVANWSFLAMGLMRNPPPPPSEVRRKGLRFLFCAGSAWLIAFAGSAVAFSVSTGPQPATVYILAGAAAVPALVAPGAMRALRRFDLRNSQGTA
jgi:hypothetical protein